MDGIYVVIPVWGMPHVERMLNYAIPSLLAGGNIPALAERYPVKALIYTNSEDAAAMRERDALHDLRCACDVEIIEIGADRHAMGETLHPGHRHGGTMMKVCHNYGLKRAWDDHRGFCPGVADQFYSNGWGENILACIDAGKHALMQPGYSLPPEFTTVADEAKKSGVISIGPLDASRHLLRLMDGENDDWSIGKGGGNWPAIKGRGFVVRRVHVGVDFIIQRRGPVWCKRSCDNDLAHQGLDSKEDILAMKSTTRHFVAGIEGLGTSSPSVDHAAWQEAAAKCAKEELTAIWLKHACNDWHRDWMGTNWWCEDGTLTPEEKSHIERLADGVVARSFDFYRALLRGEGRPEMLEAERQLTTWW